jgi:A/G-specific adenine glycosylase
MAQQTQVSRVAVYYKQWLKLFPTFTALANAATADVLRAWSGLGYNSRALRFHQLAKHVAGTLRSRLPRDPELLQSLPGIGRYTAHAVLCFSFGERVPVVDVNIRRILTRWRVSVPSAADYLPEHDVWNEAERMLPKKAWMDWNQSLMDFGATVCTARSPKCGECPVASLCASAFSPVFLQAAEKKKKNEPQWRGIPRRLYRGRVLKILHHHSFTAAGLCSQLWEQPNAKDEAWMETLLQTMQKDGLLTRRGAQYRIAGT